MMTHWKNTDVFDVRSLPFYQAADIDFIHLRDEAGELKARTLELKVDFRVKETGNLFIEPKGWLKKTKAETIAYLDVVGKKCYYIKTKKLKRKIKKYADTFRKASVRTRDFGGYATVGLIVPVEWVIAETSPIIEDLSDIL